MKLKASIDYGVRAIVYLAIKGTTCSSKEISEKMDVPRDYLIQLGLRLRDCGLIQARPGKNGGYVLSKSPSEITVKQIFDAFDGDQRGLRHPLKGSKNDAEMIGKVMQSHRLIVSSLNAFLESITVQDLIDAEVEEGSEADFIAAAFVRGAERRG